MTQVDDKQVPLIEAARTLYRTRAPSDKQVFRVIQLMKSGAIPTKHQGKTPLKWTTTEAALADYMARRQLKRSDARRKSGAKPVGECQENSATTRHHEDAANLEHVYRNIWRDYFLAVMLRRRMTHRSAGFRRAVVAGQCAVLMAVLVGVFGSVQSLAYRTPAERQAVIHWIEAHTDAFSVKSWQPTQLHPEGPGMIVEVKYRYQKESRRWIHTDRTFHVIGGHVTELVPQD